MEIAKDHVLFSASAQQHLPGASLDVSGGEAAKAKHWAFGKDGAFGYVTSHYFQSRWISAARPGLIIQKAALVQVKSLKPSSAIRGIAAPELQIHRQVRIRFLLSTAAQSYMNGQMVA